MYLLLFFSLSSFAQTYISKSYYGDPPEMFRVELAATYPGCKESKLARKIFHDGKNELREIATFHPDGKLKEEGGADNKPALRKEVEAIFAKAEKKESPCVTPADAKKVEDMSTIETKKTIQQ